jgi:hypothetical protein
LKITNQGVRLLLWNVGEVMALGGPSVVDASMVMGCDILPDLPMNLSG